MPTSYKPITPCIRIIIICIIITKLFDTHGEAVNLIITMQFDRHEKFVNHLFTSRTYQATNSKTCYGLGNSVFFQSLSSPLIKGKRLLSVMDGDLRCKERD